MKYYVYRISKATGRKEYKINKTLDNWAGEALKPKCWQFSKQGAAGIVKFNTERSGWHYEYGFEEV